MVSSRLGSSRAVGLLASSKCRPTSSATCASACRAIQAIIISRMGAAPAQVMRLGVTEKGADTIRTFGNNSWKPARLSQWMAAG